LIFFFGIITKYFIAHGLNHLQPFVARFLELFLKFKTIGEPYKFMLFPPSFFFGIPQLREVGNVLFAKYSYTRSLVLISAATTLNSTSATRHGEPSYIWHKGLVILKFSFIGFMTIVISFSLLFSSAFT
jgi:hypothetical protein